MPAAAAAVRAPLRRTAAPMGANAWPRPSKPVPRLMPLSSVLCQECRDGSGAMCVGVAALPFWAPTLS
eukprot:scaffold1076_cov20-Tisochrysis_lutea.AAC.3